MSAKLTPEELAKVNSLGERYSKLFASVGQLTVRVKEYQKDIDSLLEEYPTLLAEEEELTASLEAKYGQGAINLMTGEITPAN